MNNSVFSLSLWSVKEFSESESSWDRWSVNNLNVSTITDKPFCPEGSFAPSLQSISTCDTSFIPVVCAWMSLEGIVIRIILQTCHWHLHCFKTIAAYDLPLNLCHMVIVSGSKGKFGVMGARWGRCLLWVHQRHRSWLALRVPSTTGTEYWGSDWPLYLW